MYDASIAFTAEEVSIIELAGLTVAELTDFYSRFPDQNLDTAIGGALMEKAQATATVEKTEEPVVQE